MPDRLPVLERFTCSIQILLGESDRTPITSGTFSAGRLTDRRVVTKTTLLGQQACRYAEARGAPRNGLAV